MSLPTRERGLKYLTRDPRYGRTEVAPYAGAWIEICVDYYKTALRHVAPYAGAWIEIGLSKWHKYRA